MHIVFITHEYPTIGQSNGGVGSMVKFLAEYLTANNILVSVVGVGYTHILGHSIENGVRLFRLPKASKAKFSALKNAVALNRKLSEIHKVDPIDVVETPELGLALLKKLKNVVYIIRMHGGHAFFSHAENRNKEFFKSFLERLSFFRADHIIAVSQYVRDRTFELLGYKNRKAVIIPNPLDLAKFKVDHLPVSIDGKILFVGTIVEKKGIRQLIQAMEMIVEKYPAAHLIVLGRKGKNPKTKEPYFPYLERQIPEIVKDKINFLGSVTQSEVINHIKEAAVCAYPSHMEAHPVAWLEAMGLGKPFVGSITGPGPEVIEHGVNGLLADPFSPEDIAEKVLYLLANPNVAKQIGANARKFVEQKYSLEIIGHKNIEFYRSITK
jgi:glycosyltransferase involved in cell wall biosynthesis